MNRATSCACLLILLLLARGSALGQDNNRDTAENRLAEINVAITQLQQRLQDARTDQQHEQDLLKALELDIQANALGLRELSSQRQAQQDELARLEHERRGFLQQLEQNRSLLGEQIRAAWRLGRESRLKLVLNQDSPAQLNRTLAYYDYFSRAQAGRITDLKDTLAGLDAIGEAINTELMALAAIEQQHQAAETDLQQRRQERLTMLARLDSQIESEQRRLEQLRRDREDLEKVLEQLDDALADIPANLGDRLHPTTRRGQLPMPLAGPVQQAFGQQRGAGLKWQGWMIGADSGEEVASIAYGRVAYADWLRGYGLLMIIDHGDGFMSLYGNNESLLVEVGNWVEAGDTIATTGMAPNQGQARGLYFELRNQGKAVDPAVWINRR